ncbi:hypothetical protein BKK50_04680 [Rodentibacter rarus]|uniref:Dynamin N-terminal domain-containing protein n=1 Tax=Rodentibacter rarus TaxID=1908260 RepID=A0A1V3INC0_9PAST|nr:dynamin family protein [Rodentibacter rarus]OOF43489.1 hypothetical protein BKK50_04680 [Rodentibacter rarus]
MSNELLNESFNSSTSIEKQQQFLNYISQINEVIKTIFNEEKEILNSITKLYKDIKTTQLVIPVIGGFSAGKSTLINSFLGKEYLSTDVRPETALAAELHYSEDEKIVAITTNDMKEEYPIEQGNLLKEKAGNYKYLQYYINSEKLKNISPLILVDMPGFDSPLQGHNKAIHTYLNRQAHFIILINIEDGTVVSSLSKEIGALQEFGKGFTFCLSKTNLRPTSQVKEIQEDIAEYLLDEFDYDREIILLDNNGGENLNKILTGIDPNQFFNSIFIERLKENNQEIINNIQSKLTTLDTDKESVKNAIRDLNNGIKNLELEKDKILKSLERDNEQDIRYIISRVCEEIYNKASYLASIGINNPEALKRELEYSVQTTLTAELKEKVKKRAIQEMTKFSHVAELGLSSALSSLNMDSKFIQDIVDSCKKSVEDTSIDMSDIVKSVSALASVFSGGILATIARILTAALPFLEGIFKLFSSNSSGEEEDPVAKLEEKIKRDVVNELRRKLEEIFPNIFNEAINRMIVGIADEFSKSIKNQKESIEGELQMKEKESFNIERRIAELKTAQNTVSRLSQKFLNSEV